MRKDFGCKPWLYPMPVLIVGTYNENNTPNAMNAAWGGIYSDNMIGICLSETHKTTQNILVTKSFTVSIGTEDQMTACDYVGLVSGNKVPNKFDAAGFHAVRSAFVNAPIIKELPMTLECEFVSYDKENNFMVGKIVNVSVDESILTSEGKIDPSKLRPILFDPCNHHYLKAGDKAGDAFKEGKQLL